MGGAPQGDVDAEGPVPQLVEREGDQAAQAERAQRQRRPRHPQPEDPPADRGPVEGGEQHDHPGRDQQTTEGEHDHGVRRGEQVLVPPVIDVERHVPVQAEHPDAQQEQPGEHAGHRPPGVAGQPLEARGDGLAQHRDDVGLLAGPARQH